MIRRFWARVKGWFAPAPTPAIDELDLTKIRPMAGGSQLLDQYLYPGKPTTKGHHTMLGLGM